MDLSQFPFDHDLTMAFLLANPDGTVYHRYGGRTDVSPMNMTTLIDIMGQGMTTHREYLKSPKAPKRGAPLRIKELVDRDLKGHMRPVGGCYHCHYAREARQFLAVRNRTWKPNHFWIWPAPRRLGMEMRQDKQYQIRRVLPGSAAATAGMQPGDRLQTLSGKRILSKYDIQWILENATSKATRLGFTLRRNGETIRGDLQLARGWKVGDPREHDWRVDNGYTEHMRKYLPTPGLAGNKLTAQQLAQLSSVVSVVSVCTSGASAYRPN